MSSVARLAFANFIARRVRYALTILAVGLSVALVVSITSGYASLEYAARNFVEDYIGSVDFEVMRPDDPRPAIPPTVIEQLRADPRVIKVTSRVEVFATPIDPEDRPVEFGRTMLFGIEDDLSSMGRPPKMEEGRFLEPGERDAIVLDQNTLQTLKLNVGDWVTFGGKTSDLKLQIVGVVRKPALMKMFFKSGYVPIDPLRQFVAPDRPGYATKLRGEFDLNVDSAAFLAEWQRRLAAIDSQYTIELVRDNRETLDNNLLGLRLASYLGSTVALSAAAFIILASLMTGVQEQRRQLAMLRAVGATRWQVGRLVCTEGLFIGLAGGLAGIPVGIAGIYLLAWLFPDVFDSGVRLDVAGMVYALLVAALASLLASLLPAWWASRAKPIDAMGHASEESHANALPWKWLLVGFVLAMIDTFLIFGPLERMLMPLGFTPEQVGQTRLFGHFIVGLPALLIGALLVAPLVVRIVEAIGTLLLPPVMRVPRSLLKQQLTESTWRSAATGVALMIGLMLLITMNSQGRSAMEAWKLPTRFPDVFIVPDASHGTISISAAELEEIRKLPQIKPGKVMPISANALTLGAKVFDIGGGIMPEHTMFVGVDPSVAFDMMELDFRDGNEATAKRMMVSGEAFTLRDGSILQATIEQETDASVDLHLLDGTRRTVPKTDIASRAPGRYLVVTDEFRKLKGFKTGDTFGLRRFPIFGQRTDFVIVGVVWSPGMDVLLNTFDLPARVKKQTAATVFGTLANGRDYFGLNDAFAVAAELQLGVERQDLIDELRKTLGREGMNVADVRAVKHQIEEVFKTLMRFASTVAWLAMAVATLGVGNAIVASIRTRQWRLGILRAVGLTRAELLRLLLAEAILLSLVGVVLGTAFGLLLSANARHLYSVFIGFDAPLVIPWDLIWMGGAAIVLMGLAATILPSAMAARKEPLSLLQAGRAAT